MFDKFERVSGLSERKQLHCNSCRRKTIHAIEGQCRATWGDGHVDGGYTFSTYRCGGCDTVCYETASWHSEDYDYDDDGHIYAVTTYTQYPPPSSASFAFEMEYVPPALTNLIEEMMYAFAGTKLTLATVGMRMVIEFIVNDANCPGKNLLAKIDALHAQGLIDERQQALLQKIRTRGNAGAHGAAAMAPKELVAGMGVLQLLLERIYNGPGRHAELMRQAERAFGTEAKEPTAP